MTDVDCDLVSVSMGPNPFILKKLSCVTRSTCSCGYLSFWSYRSGAAALSSTQFPNMGWAPEAGYLGLHRGGMKKPGAAIPSHPG